MTTPTLSRAGVLWDYLSAGRRRARCDLIVAICSYDLRVCDHACSLLHDGLAPELLFSGGHDPWTRMLWDRPAAEVYAERAGTRGAHDGIVVEPHARNLAESIVNARARRPAARRVLFVGKACTLRRTALTVPVKWPSLQQCMVDAPPERFPCDTANVIGIAGLIEEMVGEIHRILHYADYGFLLPAELPHEVLNAWHGLIAEGYDRLLLRLPQPLQR